MQPRARHLLIGSVALGVVSGSIAGVIAFIAEDPTWLRVRLVLAVGLALAVCGVVARLCWPPIYPGDGEV